MTYRDICRVHGVWHCISCAYAWFQSNPDDDTLTVVPDTGDAA